MVVGSRAGGGQVVISPETYLDLADACDEAGAPYKRYKLDPKIVYRLQSERMAPKRRPVDADELFRVLTSLMRPADPGGKSGPA